jgi:pimeloyl-ACP methyl ester carboxylesterase
MSRRLTRVVALMVVVPGWASVASAAEAAPAIEDRFADVNGVRLHYLAAGRGDPIILLHGYAQTSHMWRPLIAELARTNTVIAPDLRGFGQSSRPDGGYDKKTMAQDVHALAESLGHRRVAVVGHDIGLMVAYAYAAQYPAAVERIALMDAFLPGVGEWQNVWLLRDLWHFQFYGDTPLKLVAGRERTYLEHFWNDFAADPKHSVPEPDRQFYADQYAQPGAMRAGFEVFRAFPRDARDFADFAKISLTMPMLVLTGEKASGEFLIQQGHLVATDVQGVVVKGSGHWLIDEAPDQVIPRLVTFLTAAPTRLTPPDIARLSTSAPGPGTSGVSGIKTTVLSGDPKSPGLYTLRLTVPPNTRIESHRHRDDRSATVVSGTWRIGFGPRFDETQL